MSILDQIKPRHKNLIYDMVRDAGVDVSDWEASRGNALSAAANPKYCYNWSFVQPNEVVVLSLWHSDLEEKNGEVTATTNARDIAKSNKGVRVRRASEMDEAIQEAHRKSLPIRVVLCVRTQRSQNDSKSNTSRVHFRSLDPEPWHVEKYDDATGQSILVRGLGQGSEGFVDQFDVSALLGGSAGRIETRTFPFVRRPDVRRYVLVRSNGKCEYCGSVGFTMANGKVYVETHHVVPLNEMGEDSVGNVVALCPNHHREAHYGKNRAEIRKKLQEKLASLAPNKSQ